MKLLKITLLGLLISCSSSVHAQFLTGYPCTGSLPSTVFAAGTEFATDSTRGHVELITAVSPTQDQLKIDATNNHKFSDWKAGDRAMVIQMKSGPSITTGLFEEVNVISVTAATNTLTISKLVNGFTFKTLGSPETRLQVIRIARYNIPFIDRSVITCNKWDGYTGGVLCMEACRIKMNMAVITASGCGYRPEDVMWGSGGMPGTGDNVYTNAGGGFPAIECNYPFCTNPMPVTADSISGNYGEDGEDVPFSSLGSNGTTTVISMLHTYGSPSFSGRVAKMGSAGYAPSGQVGGKGGDGGGHGGKGGATNAPSLNPGSPGANGANAKPGGDPGQGARGGGIILIKTRKFFEQYDPFDPIAYDINWQSMGDLQWLWAAGDNGDHGKSGGAGGTGGAGGIGGIGTQIGSQLYYSGGNGGHGDDGMGGNGGDGSYGARGGTIFLYMNATAPVYTQPLPNPFDFQYAMYPIPDAQLKTGDHGDGGPGGYTAEAIAQTVTLTFPYTTPYSSCPGPIERPRDYCDCDAAMKPFQTTYPNNAYATSTLLAGGAQIRWQSGIYESIYDTLTGELVTTNSSASPVTRYHCGFYKRADANYIFRKVSYHEHNILYRHIELKAQLNTISPTHFEYRFYDDQQRLNARYVSDNGSRYFIYDFSPNHVRADTAACNTTNPGFGSHFLKGNTGSKPDAPITHVNRVPGSPNSHFDFNMSSPFMPDTEPDDQGPVVLPLNVEVLYDKAGSALNIINEEPGYNKDMDIQVFDASGRLVSRFKAVPARFSIDTRNYVPGMYLVRVISGGRIATQKIIVD